jgi:hypothetical protein
MSEKIYGILCVLLIAGFVFFYAFVALPRSERAECLEWKDEAQHYLGYYITKWQKMQCDHYNISIDTEVK